MARRRSGGTFGKLALLGIGALIGSMAAQKKTGSSSAGTESSGQGNMKASLQKGLDTLNKQSGGMVDKVKPQVNRAIDKAKPQVSKAFDKAKEAIEKQQQTMKSGQGSSDSNSAGSTTERAGSAPTGTPTPGGTSETSSTSTGVPDGTVVSNAPTGVGEGTANRQDGTTIDDSRVNNFEPPRTTSFDSSEEKK